MEHRLIGWLVVLSLLTASEPKYIDAAEAKGDFAAGPALPGKSLTRLHDGSLVIYGHWTLKESEDPENPKGKLFRIAAQPQNSTIIRCWSSKPACEEYRAEIMLGTLLSREPASYEIASWLGGRIVAVLQLPANAEILLHIDADSEYVEMEYRRDPSPGRSRIFERWVLQ